MYIVCMYYIGVKMIRTQIYFTKRQKKFFKKRAKKLETSYASLIRRVLDAYIEKENRNGK